jgi:serine protease Do
VPSLTAEAVFRLVCDAVVAIEVPDGMGAGVLLSASGLIATNHHLIEGWSTAVIRFRDGSTTRARVVRSHRDPDLAFLQLDEAAARGAAERVQGFLIADQAPPGRRAVIGETVYAIGHPLGLDYTLTRGIVSAVDRDIDGWRYLQVDAAINPGNSGGPLYGENGDLVGIISCSRLESQGLNFAVPADVVYGLFNAYLEERSRGGLHYCTVCGTASRNPRYCEHCGSLIALIEVVDEEGDADADADADADTDADTDGDGEGDDAQERENGALNGAPPLCPCCGARSRPGERYCAVCGATL